MAETSADLAKEFGGGVWRRTLALELGQGLWRKRLANWFGGGDWRKSFGNGEGRGSRTGLGLTLRIAVPYTLEDTFDDKRVVSGQATMAGQSDLPKPGVVVGAKSLSAAHADTNCSCCSCRSLAIGSKEPMRLTVGAGLPIVLKLL